MKDSVKFHLGQIIYSVLNVEFTGQITGILFRSNGPSYLVTWSNDLNEKYHSECELSSEKQFSNAPHP